MFTSSRHAMKEFTVHTKCGKSTAPAHPFFQNLKASRDVQ